MTYNEMAMRTIVKPEVDESFKSIPNDEKSKNVWELLLRTGREGSVCVTLWNANGLISYKEKKEGKKQVDGFLHFFLSYASLTQFNHDLLPGGPFRAKR